MNLETGHTAVHEDHLTHNRIHRGASPTIKFAAFSSSIDLTDSEHNELRDLIVSKSATPTAKATLARRHCAKLKARVA
jgi:hypothetical protein